MLLLLSRFSGQADRRVNDLSCVLARKDGNGWPKNYRAEGQYENESYLLISASAKKDTPDTFFFIQSMPCSSGLSRKYCD